MTLLLQPPDLAHEHDDHGIIIVHGARAFWYRGGKLRPVVAGGAVTASGPIRTTFKKMWDGTDLVVDFANDTIKNAIFTNSITPNFDSDTAYGSSPYNANEVSGTGYTAGGPTLGTKTLTISSKIIFDCADPTLTGATVSNMRCALVWDDTVASDLALWLQTFGADYSVVSGTFTQQLAAGGYVTLT